MNLTEDQRREINQFIAEKRGWTSTKLGIWTSPDGSLKGGSWRLPKYCDSLDACHDIIIRLDAETARKFSNLLASRYHLGCWEAINATAEQRALALFLTLGGVL